MLIKKLQDFQILLIQIRLVGEEAHLRFLFFSEEECAIELTFENEMDTLRDTINILSTKSYDNGIWFEDFEDGLPEEGLVYYNTEGGGMTFSLANDDPLLGNNYFKMGGRVNWDWALGNIDLPVNINEVSQNSDNLFINIGILSDLETYTLDNL